MNLIKKSISGGCRFYYTLKAVMHSEHTHTHLQVLEHSATKIKFEVQFGSPGYIGPGVYMLIGWLLLSSHVLQHRLCLSYK